MSNASKFLQCYNKLDGEIRTIFSLHHRSTFSDAVRKASEMSPVVRKYADDLLSFAKLRNAIVHDSDTSKIIAEPHADVVKEFEKIVEMVLTPPKIISWNSGKNIVTLNGEESLEDTVLKILETGFSNLPVYARGTILGVVNNKRLVEIIARAIKKGLAVDKILKEAKAKEAVFSSDEGKYYIIKSSSTRIDEIVRIFERKPNLTLIIITKSGQRTDTPMQVVAPSDVVALSNMIEHY